MKNRFVLALLLAGVAGFFLSGCCCGCSGSRDQAMGTPAFPGGGTSAVPETPLVSYQTPVVNVPQNEVIVRDPDPQPYVEVVDVGPTQAQVWVCGHWVRSDQRWIWIPGRTEIWQRPGAEVDTAMGGVAD
jgi:hypothetical protein